jgi:glutathione S-transferase P
MDLPNNSSSTSPWIYTGRGEPIRLILASQDVDFDDLPVDFAAMKSDKIGFPCGQVPRFQDDTVDMVQSNAIIRHLARKYNMYGADLKEQAMVDQILETVESIKVKYLALIYEDQLSDEAKAAYYKARIDVAGAEGRNGGAHFAYLDCMLKKYQNGGQFILGEKFSAADIVLFDTVDMHLRIYGDEFKRAFPALAAHHDAVAAVPSVAAYLASDRRHPQQNGNPLG